MIRIASIWERGWNTPIKEADLWVMVAREFGIEKFLMTPVSGIDNIYVEEFKSMEDAIAAYPDLTIVFVDEKADDNLDEFIHPENALYIFGSVSVEAFNLYDENKHKAIKLTTPCNTALLWGHQIAALVLYDRFKKQI